MGIMSDTIAAEWSDPVVEAYKRDVDRTLLRENLKHTPEERLLKLQDFVRFFKLRNPWYFRRRISSPAEV